MKYLSIILFFLTVVLITENYTVRNSLIRKIKYVPQEVEESYPSYNNDFVEQLLIDNPSIILEYIDFHHYSLTIQSTPEITRVFGYGVTPIYVDSSRALYEELIGLSLNSKKSLSQYSPWSRPTYLGVFIHTGEKVHYFSYQMLNYIGKYEQYNRLSMTLYNYLHTHKIYDPSISKTSYYISDKEMEYLRGTRL